MVPLFSLSSHLSKLAVSALSPTKSPSWTSRPSLPATSTQRTAPTKPNAVVNARQVKVNQDYHHRAKELDRGFGGDSSDRSEAELSSYGKSGKVPGPVVGAYGEMSDDVYVIAEAVAEELATEHCGFYSDKKQCVVAAFFLSQLYRSWGLVAHRGWARLMLDRKCLVEVPNAPRHRAERAHAEADYGDETALENYFNPEAGHCTGPAGPTDA